ncbi:hypothetical protein XaFJ1_GM001480 [Xanthomonas albilineans]|nr:hypothetical protein XaFJ1_GM001480 [Xanthomonas albilineans]
MMRRRIDGKFKRAVGLLKEKIRAEMDNFEHHPCRAWHRPDLFETYATPSTDRAWNEIVPSLSMQNGMKRLIAERLPCPLSRVRITPRDAGVDVYIYRGRERSLPYRKARMAHPRRWT